MSRRNKFKSTVCDAYYYVIIIKYTTIIIKFYDYIFLPYLPLKHNTCLPQSAMRLEAVHSSWRPSMQIEPLWAILRSNTHDMSGRAGVFVIFS